MPGIHCVHMCIISACSGEDCPYYSVCIFIFQPWQSFTGNAKKMPRRRFQVTIELYLCYNDLLGVFGLVECFSLFV